MMRSLKLLTFAAMIFFGAAVGYGQDESGRKLTTSLTGAAEVPGPGDADGTGTATIRINQGQNQVCYELMVSAIDTATAAHIHEAAAGSAGSVVVTLGTPGADGKSSGCVENVDADLVKRLRQSPEMFYVNVHNAAFPDGAIRGQLGKKP
jgi:hypothetical protein